MAQMEVDFIRRSIIGSYKLCSFNKYHITHKQASLGLIRQIILYQSERNLMGYIPNRKSPFHGPGPFRQVGNHWGPCMFVSLTIRNYFDRSKDSDSRLYGQLINRDPCP